MNFFLKNLLSNVLDMCRTIGGTLILCKEAT
jgi:hypothetical protein